MQAKVVEAIEIPNEKSRPQYLARLKMAYSCRNSQALPSGLSLLSQYHTLFDYCAQVTVNRDCTTALHGHLTYQISPKSIKNCDK
jgi:hypothetical protein